MGARVGCLSLTWRRAQGTRAARQETETGKLHKNDQKDEGEGQGGEGAYSQMPLVFVCIAKCLCMIVCLRVCVCACPCVAMREAHTAIHTHIHVHTRIHIWQRIHTRTLVFFWVYLTLSPPFHLLVMKAMATRGVLFV